MIKVITMKENNSTSEEEYFKDVEISALIVEWVPVSVMIILSAYIFIGVIIHVLFYANSGMKWYSITGSFFLDVTLPFLVLFVLFLLEGRKRYHLMKKESYASISDKKLILRFWRDSFLWDDIQKVDLEGNRKLIITFLDIRVIRRKRFDLNWLQEKEDFICSLKNNCTARNIPFHESEINFLSRIDLFLNLVHQYPFV